MMRSPLVLIILVLLGRTSHAQEKPRDAVLPVLVVSGTGEISVHPDEATVRIGVTRQAPAARDAQQQANDAAQRIVNSIQALGVSDNQIQTAALTLHPVYASRRPEGSREAEIVAYRASNLLCVRLENLSLAGPVIDAATEAGANQIEGISFGLRNDRDARAQALREAVGEARLKAEAMAQALDVRLAEVLEISEGGVAIHQPVFAERLAAAVQVEGAPVSPGQVRVSAGVTIRYRIQNR